ncbi:MAG: head decoration protein [Anaerolineae bacterium]|nr:head decoration protein [Anaerolineae bacterium]
MAALTQGARAVEFILSMAQGNRSVERGTLASGQNLTAGTVIQVNSGGTELEVWDGTIDSTGGYDPHAIGILMYDTDATSAAKSVSYLARDAEVKIPFVTYPAGKKDNAIASLATLGIIGRDEIT